MRVLQLLLAGGLAAILLGACNQPPQAATTVPATAAAGDQAATAPAGYPGPAAGYPGPAAGYPGPAADASNPYPGPNSAPSTPTIDSEPIVVPQPSSAEVGVANGTVLRIAEGDQHVPLRGYDVYLGRIISSNTGVESMVELDKTTSPRARTNGLGQFVFTDVPPGRYGLMLDTPEGALLLNNPDDGSDLIVEIAGGQVQDLGELAYPLQEDWGE